MSIPAAVARKRFGALGTTAELLVTDPAVLAMGESLLGAQLTELDAACSRFRSDSEIARLQRWTGRGVAVSAVLFEALSAAVRAAELTDGLVDPTVGAAVRGLGYDRDFALVGDDPRPVAPASPAPGWWRIGLVPERRQVVVPHGVVLDLGATAKAWAADRAAATIAGAGGCGVLVALGGDIAVGGPAPEAGWRVTIGDDHTSVDPLLDPTVTISSGGLATSTTVRRAWRRAGRRVHHIVDPRTGDVPASRWRTVSVAAGSCLDANTASTAAVILGDAGAGWLRARGLPARLVADSGQITCVGGWPEEPPR